jgi:ornithine carbamoyltransferase
MKDVLDLTEFNEQENRLHVQKALLLKLLKVI